jgi:hypothetical protein
MSNVKFKVWDPDRRIMFGPSYTTKELVDKYFPPGSPWVDKRLRNASDLPFLEYTGFKDCHGAEIYEHDILSPADGISDFNDLVVQQKGGTWVIECLPYADEPLASNADDNGVIHKYHISGNIYENT